MPMKSGRPRPPRAPVLGGPSAHGRVQPIGDPEPGVEGGVAIFPSSGDLLRQVELVFESIEQVQQITDAWLTEYNEERPHDALGRVPPLTYLPRRTTIGESSFKLST